MPSACVQQLLLGTPREHLTDCRSKAQQKSFREKKRERNLCTKAELATLHLSSTDCWILKPQPSTDPCGFVAGQWRRYRRVASMGVEVDGAACPRGARPAAPDIGWLPRSRSVRPHLTNFGLVHTTTIPGHLSRAKIWLPNYYYSSMAHWHVQNFEEEKIKGTLPRRSSTLFIHHVMVITCLSQRQEENDPFGTWIPQSCHGDDDLFQQATCRLLASHHRKRSPTSQLA